MTNTQLPAHLLALFNAHPEAAQIGSSIQSEAHNKIRYSGSKFKLIKATGEEIAVPTAYLDVIVVGINEHKSHTVYDKAFDPKDEPTAPVWSSDDGTPVPEEHATKVVSDYRRWAVLIADNPNGGVFELRVSAGSITNGDRYVTALKNHGAPIASMVTRISFDASFDYPKLVFTPTSYLNEAQGDTLGTVLKSGTAQIALAIGKGKNTPMLAAPIATAAIEAPKEESAAPVKRTRVKKEEAPTNVVAMPTAAAATVTNPTPTDANLDSLLSSIMGR